MLTLQKMKGIIVKKIFLISELLLLAGCVDTAMLGHPNDHYPTTSADQVEVRYNTKPSASCTQIAITIPPLGSTLKESIDLLRTEAAKVGGTYVNIAHLGYTANWSGPSQKSVIGVVYRCSK